VESIVLLTLISESNSVFFALNSKIALPHPRPVHWLLGIQKKESFILKRTV